MSWFYRLFNLKHPCKYCEKPIWSHQWFCNDECCMDWYDGNVVDLKMERYLQIEQKIEESK